jgi:hypothetical protein
MKKLLAILVIVMLAVPMFAGTDVLNFMWFNNKVGFAFSDRSNLPSAGQEDPAVTTDSGTDANSNATGNGLNYYNIIEQFMCGMWGTAYDGDPIKLKMDFFNYFTTEMGDWTSLGNGVLQINEHLRFKAIMDVGAIYSLAIGSEACARIFPLDAGTGGGKYDSRWGFMNIGLLFENTIKIPNIMNIALNSEFQFNQWGGAVAWARGPHDTQIHTDLYIYLTAALNGSYSFGFSWSLSQDIILKLDLENVAGNDITNGDGGLLGSGAQPNYFSNTPFFATTLSLSQDILSLAGVKDVSLKVSLDEKLLIQCPYSVWNEETKLINTQGKYGLVVGFYGFSVGGFFTLATQDSYNTDVPMNGYDGSGPGAVIGAQYDSNGDGVITAADASGRNPGRGQAGCMITFGYSRGFFGFDLAWHGQGQFRDYDYEKDNFESAVDKGSNLTVDNGGLFRIDTMYYRWSNMLSASFNLSW